MKTLVCAVLALSAIACQAQSSKWQITDVHDAKKVIAGYIMHTYALGTVRADSTQKITSGLRLICASRPSTPPIIGVYWDRPMPIENFQYVTVTIDGKKSPPKQWAQDDSLVFTPFTEIPQLVKSMTSGKTIKFEWTNQKSENYTVAFDLEGMPIKEFNQYCGI